MKTVIVALNSKYIHSSLAPWYLKAACGEGCGEVRVHEGTINENLEQILSSIYLEKADVVAFSCYIWNISHVMKLAESLKRLVPGIVIVLGGPEVSYDVQDFMEENSFIDHIISGEGERPFRQLLEQLKTGEDDLDGINGLAYRKAGRIYFNNTGKESETLDGIISPYSEEMLSAIKGRIAYFEASRGCPFSCSYCISSISSSVRRFSTERVEEDLEKLVKSGVRQIKFVDRTFNCNKTMAKEILSSIIIRYRSSGVNFHFEAAADLFDDEMLNLLSEAPAGLIQLEMGIQTANETALKEINRKTDLDKLSSNIIRLMNMRNMNIHLDLIAGLPFEDIHSFRKSFNFAFGFHPHQLQLGFLKLLKGSGLRRNSEMYGYKFRKYAPYEVLCSSSLSYEELLELKGIEEMLERYYNSGRFFASLKFLLSYFKSPYEFFQEIDRLYREKGGYSRSVPGRELYAILLEYCRTAGLDAKRLNDLLRFDFFVSDNSGNLPCGLDRRIEKGFREKCLEYIKMNIEKDHSLYGTSGYVSKHVLKDLHFEEFDFDVVRFLETEELLEKRIVVLFDYSSRDKVNGSYSFSIAGI